MAETLEEQKPPEEMNRPDDSENEHQEDQRNAEEPQNLPNAHVEDPPRLGEKRISFNLEEELESSIKGGAPACNDAEQSFNIAPTTDSEEAGPMQEEEVVGTISNVTPTVRASNRFLGSFRKSKRRFKKFREIYNAPKEPPDSCDILSTLIEGQMFHIAFSILSELSAADMETCERVCRTWANFIQSERLWERSVKKRAKTMSELVKNNGWGTYISNIGPAKSCKSNEMRSIYWKMTSFSGDYFNRKLVKHNTLCKNVSKMKWVFVSGQTSDSFVTVFSVQNGFRVQVYDSDPFKLRCETATITSGDPTPYDSLCVSATTSKIVVGGMQSQTVWVFKMKEELLDTGQKENSSLIWKLLSRSTNKGKKSQLNVTVKPINDFVVGQEISDIKLHRSGEKVAVLCPFQEKIHIIQLRDLVATHSFVIAGGARRMIWYKKCLVTATRKTGVIQVFSTQSGREKYNNTGETRRIHVFAVYGNLIATGEENLCKVYKQEELSDEIAWPVTKKYLTAICMNDVLLITGSRTGTIKIWSLIEVFTMKPGTSPVPLTKLSANNMREFGAFTTIKSIHQVKYTEIVVVSEYKHGRRFNRFTSTDKVKVIKLAKEGDDQAASPPLYLPGRC